MFLCSLSTLPIEFLLNPFYWDRNYVGIRGYINCAIARNINSRTVLSCYKYIEHVCPLPFEDNMEFCYRSLQEAKLRNVYSEVISPNLFQQYVNCMSELHRRISPCVPVLQTACNSSVTRAVKAIRFDLFFARQLLVTNPSVKIIHLVRDPRGMLLSRKSIPNRSLSVKGSTFTCKRMLDNIKHFQLIQEQYPSVALQVRYEDLATELKKVAGEVYDHVGLGGRLKNEYLSAWLKKITSPVNNVGRYRTYRPNSSAEAYDWISKLSIGDRALIESIQECAEVIDKLNYPQTLPASNFIIS